MSEERAEQAPEGTLTEELRKLIAQHLPAETAGVLRERLERLTSVEGELKALETRFGATDAELSRTRSELHGLKQRFGELERGEVAIVEREHACDVREEKCRHREEVIDLKETHATERVGEMRSVVKDVFGNSRFKHERTTSVPVPVPGLPGVHSDGMQHEYRSEPHVEQHTQTETVEGEGDAPSA